MTEFKPLDWVCHDLEICQIKEIKDTDVGILSDGHCEMSGYRILDDCRPLTLRNKAIVDSFAIYYERLRAQDGSAGFNYPDIKRYFSALALKAMDDPNANEPFKKAQEFVLAARDYTAVIDGVRLFRPNSGR